MIESLPIKLVLLPMQDILRFKDYSFLREVRQKKGHVPVELDLFKIQPLGSLITSTFSNNSNHRDGDANSRLASFISAEPKVLNILSIDLACPIIALNLEKVDLIVSNTFKYIKKLLYLYLHFISAVVDGIILVMEFNILRIELKTRAAIVAPRVNSINILLKELLGW
jgi:hypothetical protein